MKRTLFTWALSLTLLAFAGVTLGQHALADDAAAESRLLINSADARQLGYRLTWAYDLGLDGSTVRSVDMLDDMIVAIEEPTNLVTSVGTKDGLVNWRRVIGQPRIDKLFSPVRKADHLYINSENRFYDVAAPSGKELVISQLDFAVNNSPVLSGNFAIFGSSNGRIFAHDIRTGYSKWVYRMTSEILARPVLNGNQVFVADSRGVYAMFEAGSGDLLWRGKTFGRVSADPLVTRSGVFLASEDFSFYSFDRATGHDRNGWPYRTSIRLTQSPYAVANSIYLPVPSVGLVSIDPVNGAELWKYPTIVEPVYVDAANRLMISSGSSISYLDNQTGKVIMEVPTKNLSNIIHGEGFLILISADGRIQRYDVMTK